jgi:hypothetical protein
MSGKRFLLASFVLFVVAMAWNGLVHLVLLRGAEMAIAHLLRPEVADRMWLSIVATAALVCLFVFGYGRVARRGTMGEGAAYGLFFAVLAGLLVDVNQYVLYPIPGSLIAQWFAAGVVEFVLYGALVSVLCQVAGRRM